MRILVWISFPISQGKIQLFGLKMSCEKWEMGCEHSKSLFPVSVFSLLISCISHPNFFFNWLHISWCHVTTSYLNILCYRKFIWVFLAILIIKYPWIILSLILQLSTWSRKQEVGNEKWGMRDEKLEMRIKKLGNCKVDFEWYWIGLREMGNGIQTRILATEVLPSAQSAPQPEDTWGRGDED